MAWHTAKLTNWNSSCTGRTRRIVMRGDRRRARGATCCWMEVWCWWRHHQCRERPRATWLNETFGFQMFEPLNLNNRLSDLDGVFTKIFGELLSTKLSIWVSAPKSIFPVKFKGVDLTGLLGGHKRRLGVWGTSVPQRVQGRSPSRGSGGRSPHKLWNYT